MIKRSFQNMYSELLKICSMKVWAVVLILVTVAQGLLALVSAKQSLAVGLDATPESCPGLLEAMPILEFQGFDVILFGMIPLIVLGGVVGAAEFKQHCLRTTLLSCGTRSHVFFARTGALFLCALLLSVVSVVLTIAVTHLGLGEQGLTPLVFTPELWGFISLSTAALTLLTLLSYLMGFLCRSAVVPLLFLVVQAYNVGDLLAERFAACRLLPVSLANGLIASTQSALADDPAQNILFLLIWVVTIGAAAYLLFLKRDLGGEDGCADLA